MQETVMTQKLHCCNKSQQRWNFILNIYMNIYVTVLNALDCGCDFSLLVIFKRIVSEITLLPRSTTIFNLILNMVVGREILYYILYNIIKITLKIYLI